MTVCCEPIDGGLGLLQAIRSGSLEAFIVREEACFEAFQQMQPHDPCAIIASVVHGAGDDVGQSQKA